MVSCTRDDAAGVTAVMAGTGGGQRTKQPVKIRVSHLGMLSLSLSHMFR